MVLRELLRKKVKQIKIGIMKAEFYKVRDTEMEEMIKRGNKEEISVIIAKKKMALEEAKENVSFYKEIGNAEFAANEQARVNLLERQLNQLMSNK